MLVHVEVAVLLQLFCIVQGLTTGIYLLTARPRLAGNRWLGLLLGLTLQVVDYFLSRSGIYYRHRWLYFTPLFFSWSFGPLFYGCVRTRYGTEPALAKWHFGPGAVQLLFYAIVAAQDFDTKTWFWLHVHKPVTRYLEHYGAVASVLVYAGLAWRLWRGHGRQPAWLGRLLPALALFYLAAALDPLVNRAYLPAGAPTFYLTGLVLPVLAYALALLAWLGGRPRAVTAPPKPLAPPLPPPDPGQLAQLVRALAEEQLFKDPDLTLSGLARHVGLTPNAVSQLVNAGLGQSFTDWVNGYRLAEVVRRLRTDDARRFTVLALALDAGFNSKTTFNRVFKEKTGLTPSAYQKGSHNAFRDDAAPVPG